MNHWALRFIKAMEAFQELKSMTKSVPAGLWTPEYRALADKIHGMGRDYFHVGLIRELADDGVIPISEETRKILDDPKLFDPQMPDELFADVRKYAESNGYVTPSLLQRNFRISYGRAIALIERMEKTGDIERVEAEKFNSFKWQWVKGKEGASLANAYDMASRLLAFFPSCPFCGRGLPGHHAPDCEYLGLWDSLRVEGQKV